MMVKGASRWTEVPDSLPVRMSYMASISVNNQIITSGKLEKLVEIISNIDQNIYNMVIPTRSNSIPRIWVLCVNVTYIQ